MLKEQAIRKFKAFENHALGGGYNEQMRAECLKRFTKAQLLEFWAETKNLTFPETYGQTPWEVAGTVAYELAKEQEATATTLRVEAAQTSAAGRGKRAKPVQLGLFEPQQLMLL